jgi:hypothetical protein
MGFSSLENGKLADHVSRAHKDSIRKTLSATTRIDKLSVAAELFWNRRFRRRVAFDMGLSRTVAGRVRLG